jgi:hypothetical protein
MAEYSEATFPDPDELKDNARAFLASVIPGWEPSEANLDDWIIEAMAEMVAPLVETAADVPPAIFREYGVELAGVAPISPTQATGTVTVTVIDAEGWTVPEGSVFAFDADGELVAFQNVEPVVIEPGSTEATDVLVQAVEPGSLGSGLSGAATLIDPLDYVTSIVLEDQTTGGQEGESDEDYLNRLADELRLLTPRPILPEDFATLARRIPEVERALVLDGYNASTDTPNQERCVTVYIVNAEGLPVSSIGKTAVQTLLSKEREVTFLVFVEDPTYETINVEYAVTAWDTFDPVAVKAQCDTAIQGYVNPRNWGQPTFGDQRGWAMETTVRYLEVAQVLQQIEGVRYVDLLRLNGVEDDYVLDGADPLLPPILPQLGTLTGSVS